MIFTILVSFAEDDLNGIPAKFDSEYVKSDQYPYFTLDKVLSTFYDESKFNAKISTIGYISRDSVFPRDSNQVLLQRVFVTCCLAHASPVTIYLVPGNYSLADSEWVKVNGTVVGVRNELGTSPCILVERLEKIPKPENPYLNCNACPTEH